MKFIIEAKNVDEVEVDSYEEAFQKDDTSLVEVCITNEMGEVVYHRIGNSYLEKNTYEDDGITPKTQFTFERFGEDSTSESLFKFEEGICVYEKIIDSYDEGEIDTVEKFFKDGILVKELINGKQAPTTLVYEPQ